MCSFIGVMAAAFTKAAMSAPENPCANETSLSMLTVLSIGFLTIYIFNISFIESLSGRGISRSLSNRPGRNRASSIISGLLVAPITTTPFRLWSPSISVRSWLTILSPTWESPAPVDLLDATESSSSKNITQGLACLAFLNTSLMPFSDSPTHFDINSGPLILIKFALEFVATAFAIIVLPVPGGPCRSIPLGGTTSALLKRSACFKGHSIASPSSSFTEPRPPISSHLTFGFSTYTSLSADGWTSFSAVSKSWGFIFILFNVSTGILDSSKLISGNILLKDFIAASLHTASRSAPTNPCVTLDIESKFTSPVRGIPLVWISSISCRPFWSGIPISISLSNRPGRLNAGSIASGLFVAPITTTLPRDSSPSMTVSSWDTTLFSTSPDTSSLLGAIESISSINMILGAFSCACLKVSRSRSSLSP